MKKQILGVFAICLVLTMFSFVMACDCVPAKTQETARDGSGVPMRRDRKVQSEHLLATGDPCDGFPLHLGGYPEFRGAEPASGCS